MTQSPIISPFLHQNIYLAEDDAEDRSIFLDALNEVCSTSRCTTATDGKELMDVLDNTVPPKPDVIFLDINMPNKNGFDCLKIIRNSADLGTVPVVVLTTNGNEESREKAMALGANLFYEKPTSYKVLKQTLANVLSTDFSVPMA